VTETPPLILMVGSDIEVEAEDEASGGGKMVCMIFAIVIATGVASAAQSSSKVMTDPGVGV